MDPVQNPSLRSEPINTTTPRATILFSEKSINTTRPVPQTLFLGKFLKKGVFYFYPRPLPYKRPTQKNFDFPKKLEKFKFAKKSLTENVRLHTRRARCVQRRPPGTPAPPRPAARQRKLLEKNFETFENF